MSDELQAESMAEWEPMPFDANIVQRVQQQMVYKRLATLSIRWTLVKVETFPKDGLFGKDLAFFTGIDAFAHASFENEDMVLIRNAWHGFPDPPEWGLIARPRSSDGSKWQPCGYFPKLPSAWIVPGLDEA